VIGAVERKAVVLQRCDQFVGRTTNWLYDHLRYVPGRNLLVLCDQLANRGEFPLLEAREANGNSISRRFWRRFRGNRIYPTDALWLRRWRPGLLHSHFGYVAIEDFELQKFLGTPWLVSFYGADIYQQKRFPAWRDSYSRLFAESNLVLALGPHMAASLQLLGCPKDKIVVHPLGVDVDSLPSAPRALSPGAPLKVLFAGTFREKKGVEYLIQAAAKARKRGLRLHLTLVGDAARKPGDFATKEAIFRQISSLAIDDIVTHRPFLKFDELVRLALQSHVFVAPSVTSADGDAEGTPFVLQQMMATGMPVVATIHSDTPFIFGQHRNRLVPERDADAIAARLEEYADQPEHLIKDGMQFRERIRTVFNIRDCAARLGEIYDKVQQGGGITTRTTLVERLHQEAPDVVSPRRSDVLM